MSEGPAAPAPGAAAPTPPAGQGDPAGYGLRSRPEPDSAVLAVVAAAVDQVWPRPAVAEPPARSDHLRWRFSSRWWSRPVPARRERPWR